MDKFVTHKCSWENQQLGLIINTRTMTVRFTEDKILRLVITLTATWHAPRKYFTLLEGVTLLANLKYATSECHWGSHL